MIQQNLALHIDTNNTHNNSTWCCTLTPTASTSIVDMTQQHLALPHDSNIIHNNTTGRRTLRPTTLTTIRPGAAHQHQQHPQALRTWETTPGAGPRLWHHSQQHNLALHIDTSSSHNSSIWCRTSTPTASTSIADMTQQHLVPPRDSNTIHNNTT